MGLILSKPTEKVVEIPKVLSIEENVHRTQKFALGCWLLVGAGVLRINTQNTRRWEGAPM
jgi:hypothetical protein